MRDTVGEIVGLVLGDTVGEVVGLIVGKTVGDAVVEVVGLVEVTQSARWSDLQSARLWGWW